MPFHPSVMIFMKIAYIQSILLLLVGCTSKGDVDMYEYTRDDFPRTIELKGVPVFSDSVINPDEAYVVMDSLLLVSNDDPAQKEKIKLFSLKDGHQISSFFSKGHAENELISCNLKCFSSDSKLFYVNDFIQCKYWVCSVESLYMGKNPIIKSFFYSRDVLSLYPLESNYIGFNLWYMNDKKYSNGITCPIQRFDISKEKGQRRPSERHRYYVANVSGASIALNPHNGDIWVAYKHDNVIEIYDDDMILRKRMTGPERSRCKYQTREIKEQEYVFFEKESYVSSFYACFSTDKYVYLLHEDKNGVAIPPKPMPVEIYKLDWDGNLMCNYKLDRQAYEISLDSNEKNLFAICMDNENNLQVIKYTLE